MVPKILAAVVAFCCLSLAIAEDNKLPDLSGKWSLTDYNDRGDVLDPTNLGLELEFTFKENKLTVLRDKRNTTHYKYNVKKTKVASEFEIDITYEIDGRINHSLASLVDGKLIIFVHNKMRPNEPEDRPISTKEDQEIIKQKKYIVLKFKKKE
jgi:uncharacterized protein (TIGR03067 family)